MHKKAIVIHPKDNVATAVENLSTGDIASFFVGQELQQLQVEQDVPLGHKFALRRIEDGENVYKYGEAIGVAAATIPSGHHVHLHNVGSNRGRGDLPAEKGAVSA